MTTSLPANPDIDQLKRHAKTLRDLVRSDADGAVELVREHHPDRRPTSRRSGCPTHSSRSRATTASRAGPSCGPTSRSSTASRGLHTRSRSATIRRHELLRLACLTYGADDDARPSAAREMLQRDPSLAPRSIHTMAATGAVEAARARSRPIPPAHIARADRTGGPRCSTPRTPGSTTATPSRSCGCCSSTAPIRMRATSGRGYVPPFTALTGALGGGEGSQSPHHAWRAMAEVLLDAGADPNDSQAIYNRGLGDRPSDDTEYLELLYRYGFGRGDGGPWRRRLAPITRSPRTSWPRCCNTRRRWGSSIGRGWCSNTARIRTVARGIRSSPGARHTRARCASATSRSRGLLANAGADTSTVDDVQRLTARLVAGDESTRDVDPALLAEARRRDPALIIVAAERGRVDAVRLLAALGWDIDVAPSRHRAAHGCDVRERRPGPRAVGPRCGSHDPRHGVRRHAGRVGVPRRPSRARRGARGGRDENARAPVASGVMAHEDATGQRHDRHPGQGADGERRRHRRHA